MFWMNRGVMLATSVLAQVFLQEPRAPALVQWPEAEGLTGQPKVLAERLKLSLDPEIDRVEIKPILPSGGAIAVFWTKPYLAVSSIPGGSAGLCSSRMYAANLEDGGQDPVRVLYGLAAPERGKSAAEYCTASADPRTFFSAPSAAVATGAIDAFYKLVALPRAEQRRRLAVESCSEDQPIRRLCGLTAGSVEHFAFVEREPCGRTLYGRRGSDGASFWIENEGNLRAHECFRIFEGSVFFGREVRIEIGPAKPRATVIESRGMV